MAGPVRAQQQEKHRCCRQQLHLCSCRCYHHTRHKNHLWRWLQIRKKWMRLTWSYWGSVHLSSTEYWQTEALREGQFCRAVQQFVLLAFPAEMSLTDRYWTWQKNRILSVTWKRTIREACMCWDSRDNSYLWDGPSLGSEEEVGWDDFSEKHTHNWTHD